MNSKNWFVFSE